MELTGAEVLALIGGALGVLSFVWKLGEGSVGGVRLDLTIDATGVPGVSAATVTIENTGVTPRFIDYAAILIGPEEENTDDAALRIAAELRLDAPDGSARIAISEADDDAPVYTSDGRAALLPLPFIHKERRSIGQEAVKAGRTVDLGALEPGRNYRAVFYIMIRYPLGIRFWRTTSAVLAVGGADTEGT